MIRSLTDRIRIEDYQNDYEALLATRPVVAEETTVKTAISFSKATGVHLHILHVSAGETVDLIREAQKQGIHVTGETCPQYLTFTNEDYEKVGNMMKVYPPVRHKEDQEAIWEGLKDGTLSFVCSDHAPHTREEKTGSIFNMPAGMCAIETLVPILADQVNRGRLTKQELAKVLAERPAKLYGLYPNKGSLQTGTDADITIVDFERPEILKAEKLHSVSKVTAYDGYRVSAMPVCTILRGKVIVKDGRLVNETHRGKIIRLSQEG